MVDLMLGAIATVAFYNLNWNWGALVIGILTVADLWFTFNIVATEDESE